MLLIELSGETNTIMRYRPARDWDYLPPHICKYCGRRFYNDVTRYLFHKRQHEKWVRPYWYGYNSKSGQDHFTDDRPRCFREGDTQSGHDSLNAGSVRMSTCKVLLRDIRLDKTNELIRNILDVNGDVNAGAHTKEKPYPCKYCDKRLAAASNRTIHERIHTKVKPYQCKYCKKSFTSVSNKSRHERIHTKEKPYKCKYCSKSFSRLDHRTTHERIHTKEKPFHCKYCNKSFSDSSAKTSHERIHTKEKPYQCKYCNKTFSQIGNRAAHERIHKSYQR